MIVGPNGSGKSNISESVLWCMGEQSPLAVRGQSMQDVIFSGSQGLHSRRAAEVEVVIDNSDGTLPVDFSEVAISRRLDRSGEGEYRINGARCRLIDVIEILSDTGLGKEMHSIVGQGEVEEIVHSKPQQRSLLIEEAAGLGKHRKRRRRAQLKLDRTQENLDRCLDVEREARSRLRPLKRQAEAADHHRRLQRQSLELRARLVADDLLKVRTELSAHEKDAAQARQAREGVEQKLEQVSRQRDEAEQKLAARGQQRELLTKAYFGTQSAAEGVSVRLEQLRDFSGLLEANLARAHGDVDAERARQAQLQLIDGRDGPAAKGVKPPTPDARWLLEHVDISGRHSREAELLLEGSWVVGSLDDLPEGFQQTAITEAGRAYIGARQGLVDLAGGRDADESEESKERLEALASRCRRLEGLKATSSELAGSLRYLLERVKAARDEFEAEFESSRDESSDATAGLRELAATEHGLQSELKGINEQVTRCEVMVAQGRDREAEAVSEIEQISKQLGFEIELPEDELGEDGRAEIGRKLEQLTRRREQLGPVNPLARQEYEEALAHVQELKTSREDLEAALKELEQLIRDTDRRIKESFERTFEATERNFEEVVQHLFPGGRGRIRLVKPERPRLVIGGADANGEGPSEAGEIEQAEDERADDMGVEIEVTPAGKSMRRLSLLSGGEKSLVALAFMFAVFLARPCPFYILDEVEAALDDINIDRFLSLLRRYSERAQFIVVTHQRRTMEAADAIYGVSMGADGVSKVVSRKLAQSAESAELIEAAA